MMDRAVVEEISNPDGTSTTTNRSNTSQIQKCNSQQSSVSSSSSISILILGDGDLSWSLDFGRYLISSCSMTNHNTNHFVSSSSSCDDGNSVQSQQPLPTNHTTSAYYDQINIRVTCFDTMKQIEKKYPHSISFIIPQLLKLNTNTSNNKYCDSSSTNKRKRQRSIIQNIDDTNVSAKCNNSTDLSSSSLHDNNNQYHDIISNQQSPNNNNDNSNNNSTHKNNGNNNENLSQQQFSFEIYDNVNAIVSSDSKNNEQMKLENNSLLLSSSSSSQHLCHKNNVIIFNHPHLGIEDMILHRSFIHHLFDSIQNYWWPIITTTMEEDGAHQNNNHCYKVDNSDIDDTKKEVFDTTYNHNILQIRIKNVFYLTLASGQYERWECENAAKKHQLVLLKRCYFIPHPASLMNKNSLLSSQVNNNENVNTNNYYYEQRRHQSGKSFAKRIDGPSETFIYTSRKFLLLSNNNSQEVSEESLSNNITLPFDLPWFQSTTYVTSKPTTIIKKNHDSIITIPSALSANICSYCGKSFHEQRSLKNHILCKHHDRTTTKINNKNNKVDDDSNNTLLKMTTNIEMINAVHPQTIMQQEEGKEQQQTPQNSWTCSYCIKLSSLSSQTSNNNIPRIFESHASLMDHVRAKHLGIHTSILRDGERNRSPTDHDDDIVQSSSSSNVNMDNNNKNGREMSTCNNNDNSNNMNNKTEDDKWHCPICNVSLRYEKNPNDKDDNNAIDNNITNNVHHNVHNDHNKQQQQLIYMENHLHDFIPKHGELLCSDESNYYSCQFCQKQFSQNRSRLQHENFCKQRI